MKGDIQVSLTSRVIAFTNKIPAELVERRRKRLPCDFARVTKDREGNYNYKGQIIEAELVGKERKVTHPTFHDMMLYNVMSEMTEDKYLEEGFDANAVYVDQDKFERKDKFVGVTTYQPLKILEDLI